MLTDTQHLRGSPALLPGEEVTAWVASAVFVQQLGRGYTCMAVPFGYCSHPQTFLHWLLTIQCGNQELHLDKHSRDHSHTLKLVVACLHFFCPHCKDCSISSEESLIRTETYFHLHTPLVCAVSSHLRL